MNDDQALAPEDWSRRRKVVFVALGFCASVIVYLIGWGQATSSLHETIANGVLLIAGSVVLGYLGFPSIGDWHRRRSYTAIRTSPGHTGRVDNPDA
jgi:threonine/homoserine/homoserine lactone efflux protein